MTHTVHTPAFSSPRHGLRAAASRVLPSLLLVFALFFSFPAMALPPQKLLMAPPAFSVNNGELFVNLSLTVDNEDGLRDLLKDGAVLQLGLDVSMNRKRSWWTDVEVAGHEYACVIRHDPLTRDFVISLPTKEGEKTLRDKNLTRLLHATWRKLSLPVVPLQALHAQGSDEEFVISLTISLRHTEVPPWLEKSFIFWSSDVVPQEKRSLPFHLPIDQK